MLPFADITPRPFLGVDVGRIHSYKENAGASFAGAAAGIRFSGKHLLAELSAARPLSVPDAIQREPVQYYASVTASF